VDAHSHRGPRRRCTTLVNGSQQPVLIVNDMKSPPAVGRIALWIDQDTDAHFTGLRVTPIGAASSR